MQTQGRVHIFFDFLVTTDPIQRKRWGDFLKNLDSRIALKYYNKNSAGKVGINLIVDLLVGAREDIYDHAIIVSADQDLTAAIHFIQYRLKKTVTMVSSLEDLINKTHKHLY